MIYTLIEHKSKPDPRIGLQLLGYQHHILEQWDRTEGRTTDGVLRPLPALVSLVVYHGTAEWTPPVSLAEATDADAALRPYIVDFRYSLVDLGRIPDAELSRERKLRVGFLILKHGTLTRATRETLLEVAHETLDLGYDDLVTLIYYLLGFGDLDGPRTDLVRDILNELFPGEGDRVMSQVAEQWKSEGFNIGVVQGRQEGRQEGEAIVLTRQVERRFGLLPGWAQDKIAGADSATLEEWSLRILDAKTLDEVFD